METGSSYKAGLAFKQEMQSAERQAALHWKVDGKLTRDATGQAVLDISVRDDKGLAVAGLSGAARLAHPATVAARSCRRAGSVRRRRVCAASRRREPGNGS